MSPAEDHHERPLSVLQTLSYRDLKLAVPNMTGQEAAHAIISSAVDADTSELPGLILALGSILSLDEQDASVLIQAMRDPDSSVS